MHKFIATAVLAAAFATPLHAAENWVASWQASPHAAWRDGDFVLPAGVPAALAQQTVRETARLSVGGRRVRIVLSNRYGSEPWSARRRWRARTVRTAISCPAPARR